MRNLGMFPFDQIRAYMYPDQVAAENAEIVAQAKREYYVKLAKWGTIGVVSLGVLAVIGSGMGGRR